MDKIMSKIQLVMAVILLISSSITTIVSISRLEWVSVIWIIVTFLCGCLFRVAIQEFKETK